MRFFHSVYIFVPVPIIHRRDDYLRNSPALRDLGTVVVISFFVLMGGPPCTLPLSTALRVL